MPKLKIEAMTSQGAIFQGQNRPLLLYDCMESFVGAGGFEGMERHLFDELSFQQSGESTCGHIYLDHVVFLSFIILFISTLCRLLAFFICQYCPISTLQPSIEACL